MMTISTHKIEYLLVRFYDGQTSEAEEQMLRQYFASSCCDETLEGERQMFLALAGAAPAADDLQHRLSRSIDGWATVEHLSTRHTRRTLVRLTSAAAIALVLVAGATAWLTMSDTKDVAATSERDTYTDPRDAYAETQRALLLFSNSINKGLDEIDRK